MTISTAGERFIQSQKFFYIEHDGSHQYAIRVDKVRELLANETRELDSQVESVSLECVQLRNQLPCWRPLSTERVFLPQDDTFVLAWNGDSVIECWFVYEDGEGIFRDHEVGQYAGVTHWMPLPVGPKP